MQCFDQDCYPLAFGVPAVLMFLAIFLFWIGRHGYKKNPPMGNIVWLVVKAVIHALKNKFKDSVMLCTVTNSCGALKCKG